MKTYKGFNEDMTCRGFQYEEGKEYETDKAEACESGFHACEYPLDCFGYYDPAGSVFHEVEQSGDVSYHSDDTKVASTKIKIGAKLSIANLVDAAIEYTKERVKPETNADEDYGASSATGDYGASSATGYKGASSATGDYGASSATGGCGASSATGYRCSAESANPSAIAVAWGYHGKAKGVLGSYIVLADWEGDENNFWVPSNWELKGARMIHIDGKRYKADTWYTMKNGKVVVADD